MNKPSLVASIPTGPQVAATAPRLTERERRAVRIACALLLGERSLATDTKSDKLEYLHWLRRALENLQRIIDPPKQAKPPTSAQLAIQRQYAADRAETHAKRKAYAKQRSLEKRLGIPPPTVRGALEAMQTLATVGEKLQTAFRKASLFDQLTVGGHKLGDIWFDELPAYQKQGAFEAALCARLLAHARPNVRTKVRDIISEDGLVELVAEVEAGLRVVA